MTAETWPSVPKVLADALYQKFGYGSTRLDSLDEYPAVQVRRVGGADDGFTDSARIDVLVIAGDEEVAESLSERIRSFLVDNSPIRGAGLLLDGARTEVAPTPLAYADPKVSQYLATYVVDSRRF